MNYVSLRKHPQMEFVPKDLQDEFEEHVIGLYSEACEEDSAGFWGSIPSFDANIFANLKSKFLLAGIWAEASKDPSFYTKETKGKLIPEFEEYWCQANLSRIADEYPYAVNEAMVRSGQDALSVLNFHHIFYAMAVGIAPNGQVHQGFTKFPIINVW